MRFKRKIEKHLARFTLLNDDHVKNCLQLIVDEYQKRCADKSLKRLNVVLTEEEEERTSAQNRLMWMWYHQIGKKVGMTDKEVHDTMRAMFLLQIYRTAYPEYEEVASSFIGDKLADDEWQAKLKLGKMCSTTGGNASVALMNQYLNSINQWAYIHNIPLTIPNELRWIRN